MITHYEYAIKNGLMGTETLIPIINKKFENKSVSFRKFADWFEEYFSGDTVMRFVGEKEANMSANFLYHYWMMKLNGEKIFFVSPQLFYMLLNTDVNVDCSWLVSPFEEIYIHCEQNEIKIKDSRDGIIKPVRGIYLNFGKDDDGSKKMRFIATSGADGCNKMEDVNYYFTFDIPEVGTVEDSIKNTFKKWEDGDVKLWMKNLEKIQATNSIERVFRFSVNLLLYLSSKDPDLFHVKPERINIEAKKSSSKIRKAIKRSMRTAEMPYIVVGGNMPHDYVIHGIGASITHKFDVRGHWRFQWKGSRSDGSFHQEYTLVRPYQKGKDFLQQLNKKYLIGRIKNNDEPPQVANQSKGEGWVCCDKSRPEPTHI